VAIVDPGPICSVEFFAPRFLEFSNSLGRFRMLAQSGSLHNVPQDALAAPD
jgi:hypothetical protein